PCPPCFPATRRPETRQASIRKQPADGRIQAPERSVRPGERRGVSHLWFRRTRRAHANAATDLDLFLYDSRGNLVTSDTSAGPGCRCERTSPVREVSP